MAMVANVGRMLAMVEKFGFIPNNCIYLKVSKAFLENPFHAYPMIIASNWTTFNEEFC